MNSKILLGTYIFGFSVNLFAADSAATYFNLPFKSVKAAGGSRCEIFFKDAAVNGSLKDVSVDVDSVSAELSSETGSYTTINVYNSVEGVFGWLKPERVTVVVRSPQDLKIWQDYLNKLRKKRDEWKKHWNTPIRVLPPKDL